MTISKYKLIGDNIRYVSKYKIPYNGSSCFDKGTIFVLTKVITPTQEDSLDHSDIVRLEEYKESIHTYNSDGTLNEEKRYIVEFAPKILIIPSALLFVLFDQIDISNYEVIKDSYFTDDTEIIKVLAEDEFDAVIKVMGSNPAEIRRLYDLDSYLEFWKNSGVTIEVNKIK